LNEKAIQIKGLTFSYGENKILNELSLEIEANKFYSIIGPNGSGKTTLLKNMAGIITGNKNSVFINNKPIERFKTKDLAKVIACVHQNVYMDVEFTAHEIVMMGRAPYKGRFVQEDKEDFEVVRKAMEKTDTWIYKDKPINTLSGGEQQRVIAARAIAQKSEVILLDEPISHMDIQHQIHLLNIMKDLKNKVTIVAVLHDLNLAALFSDYIVLMNEGKIVEIGTPKEVINKENIKKIYNMEVELINDPVNGVPHIIPVIKNTFSE
jgi:iron complex transport system ATP-binding protein